MFSKLGTGMSNEDKEKLNLLATKLNLQIAKELKNNGKMIKKY
jgi:hypothetical protein